MTDQRTELQKAIDRFLETAGGRLADVVSQAAEWYTGNAGDDTERPVAPVADLPVTTIGDDHDLQAAYAELLLQREAERHQLEDLRGKAYAARRRLVQTQESVALYSARIDYALERITEVIDGLNERLGVIIKTHRKTRPLWP